MPTVIQPMSAVDPELVKDYLTGTGESHSIVEWKYFDRRFNQNRERGYVWISDRRARGFIGLIPFRMLHNHQILSVAWSCDWSLDRRTHPGLTGVILVRESLRPYNFVLSCGGNEKTRRLFSQIALRTSLNAGITLHAPMRAGVVLPLLQGTVGPQRLDRLQGLGQAPLRTIGHETKWEVTTEPGVSSALLPLLERRSGLEDCPLYDFEYLDWQIGRCPSLSSWTMYINSARGVRRPCCSGALRRGISGVWQCWRTAPAGGNWTHWSQPPSHMFTVEAV